jgi:DNA-directed RNA polymerase specialized sigma subunit
MLSLDRRGNQEFLRDDSPVKVSRSVKETAYKIQQVRDLMTARLGREAFNRGKCVLNWDCPGKKL